MIIVILITKIYIAPFKKKPKVASKRLEGKPQKVKGSRLEDDCTKVFIL